MSSVAVVEPRAARHERPERRRVLAAVRVVEVGQAEVVAELVREHAEAAVLRLDRVVADPEARVADLRAAELGVGGTGGAVVGRVHVPAVRPDRVLALRAAAGVLALAGVHRLEVVEVAVGLVEVAVVVVVVAVPHVERRELGLDGLVALAGRLLGVVPGVAGVLDELPGAAVVLDAVVAVGRGVAGHLHPVADLAVDGVRCPTTASCRSRRTTRPRRRTGPRSDAWLKSAIQCVLLFAGRSGSGISLCSGPGVGAELAAALVAELRQDREHLVGAGHGRLVVLVAGQLHDSVFAGGRLAGEDELLGGLATLVLALGERAGTVVEALGGGRGRVVSGCGDRGRCECHTGHHRHARRSHGEHAARTSFHGFSFESDARDRRARVRKK